MRRKQVILYKYIFFFFLVYWAWNTKSSLAFANDNPFLNCMFFLSLWCTSWHHGASVLNISEGDRYRSRDLSAFISSDSLKSIWENLIPNLNFFERGSFSHVPEQKNLDWPRVLMSWFHGVSHYIFTTLSWLNLTGLIPIIGPHNYWVVIFNLHISHFNMAW